YIATMEPKIAEAAALIEASGRPIELEVDGGISPDTAPGAVAAGARVLVAGSALYRHPGGLADAVSVLRQKAEAALP
ncbi:MAG: ribulose-phosphate 3-epimerase, partial [Acidimicrobiales bacterium]